MGAVGWTSKFVGFSSLTQTTRDILHRDGLPRIYKAGDVLFSPGATPDALYFLTEGTVRVFQRSESGREIVLYRVEAGQSCVLTTACVMA
ncbi:MAG: Crp/Fnr family transcriptional regulator, partial [Planktomarina sp.]